MLGNTDQNRLLPACGPPPSYIWTLQEMQYNIYRCTGCDVKFIWSLKWVLTRESGWHRIGHRSQQVGTSYHRCSVKSGSKHLQKSQQKVLAWHNHHLHAALTLIRATVFSAYRTRCICKHIPLHFIWVSWLSVNLHKCTKKICKWAESEGGKERQLCNTDSQFDGFVPHDDVAWESEGLHVDDVDVSSFCADVKPFALEGQVAVCDSARGDQDPSLPGFSLSHDSIQPKSHPCP